MPNEHDSPFFGVFKTDEGKLISISTGLEVSPGDIPEGSQPFYGHFVDENGKIFCITDLIGGGGSGYSKAEIDAMIQRLDDAISSLSTDLSESQIVEVVQEISKYLTSNNYASKAEISQMIQTELGKLTILTTQDVENIINASMSALTSRVSSLEQKINNINPTKSLTQQELIDAIANHEVISGEIYYLTDALSPYSNTTGVYVFISPDLSPIVIVQGEDIRTHINGDVLRWQQIGDSTQALYAAIMKDVKDMIEGKILPYDTTQGIQIYGGMGLLTLDGGGSWTAPQNGYLIVVYQAVLGIAPVLYKNDETVDYGGISVLGSGSPSAPIAVSTNDIVRASGSLGLGSSFNVTFYPVNV